VQVLATALVRCKALQNKGFGAVLFRGGVLISTAEWAILVERSRLPPERLLGVIMEWTAPAFEEVSLNCEINSYASAKL
jgi:coenzyme PQQ precursor peptide PqqA